MYIGTCEHRNVELPTASDGLAGHGLGLGRVYGSHMSRFPCSFGSVRASVARNAPCHSPPMDISHPLDFERAAATAANECSREAVDRFRDDTQRRGGVGEANVTKRGDHRISMVCFVFDPDQSAVSSPRAVVFSTRGGSSSAVCETPPFHPKPWGSGCGKVGSKRHVRCRNRPSWYHWFNLRIEY